MCYLSHDIMLLQCVWSITAVVTYEHDSCILYVLGIITVACLLQVSILDRENSRHFLLVQMLVCGKRTGSRHAYFKFSFSQGKTLAIFYGFCLNTCFLTRASSHMAPNMRSPRFSFRKRNSSQLFCSFGCLCAELDWLQTCVLQVFCSERGNSRQFSVSVDAFVWKADWLQACVLQFFFLEKESLVTWFWSLWLFV